MDRIAAIRNIEDALAAYEAGETDLASVEERTLTTVRTYATEFEDGTQRRAYRARGEAPADGVVVAAPDPGTARERIRGLIEGDPAFEVEEI